MRDCAIAPRLAAGTCARNDATCFDGETGHWWLSGKGRIRLYTRTTECGAPRALTELSEWRALLDNLPKRMSISPAARPGMINENVSLCADEFSCSKEIPIFHINNKGALHPIYDFAIHRTKKIAVVITDSQIELWPSAFEVAFAIYIESTKS